MTNREKVLKGLECCCAMSGDECRKCPYGNECLDTNLPYGHAHLAADALALLKEQEVILLKEQEAIEPKEIINDFYPVGDYRRTMGWHCGKCGRTLMGDGNFCSYCGKAVKWDA